MPHCKTRSSMDWCICQYRRLEQINVVSQGITLNIINHREFNFIKTHSADLIWAENGSTTSNKNRKSNSSPNLLSLVISFQIRAVKYRKMILRDTRSSIEGKSPHLKLVCVSLLPCQITSQGLNIFKEETDNFYFPLYWISSKRLWSCGWRIDLKMVGLLLFFYFFVWIKGEGRGRLHTFQVHPNSWKTCLRKQF